MKKTISIMALVFVMILSCLCVAGCSDSDSKSSGGDYVGRWKYVSHNGGSIPVDELDNEWIEFTDSGKLIQGVTVNEPNIEAKTYTYEVGTYRVEGNKLIVNSIFENSNENSNQEIEISVNNGQLILKEGESTMVYEKYTGPVTDEVSVDLKQLNEIANYNNEPVVDAATVDAACKDYYAVCVAGKAPGEGTTKKEIQEYTNAATIKDALEYANLKNIDLSNMIVDSSGSIHNKDDSGNIAANKTKTALLSNPSAAGSLKALYAVGAATVDAACKDYIAICTAGKAPGEGTTKKEIQEYTNAATIKDALEYANIYDLVDLSKMSVDVQGTIFDPNNNPRNKEENSVKTALLSNPSAAGSLKALFAR